jgi:hypothetical protein
MAKLRVQAQHLKAGDIVGSGEVIDYVTINSTKWPSNKVMVVFTGKPYGRLWGKYTMINVERKEG